MKKIIFTFLLMINAVNIQASDDDDSDLFSLKIVVQPKRKPQTVIRQAPLLPEPQKVAEQVSLPLQSPLIPTASSPFTLIPTSPTQPTRSTIEVPLSSRPAQATVQTSSLPSPTLDFSSLYAAAYRSRSQRVPSGKSELDASISTKPTSRLQKEKDATESLSTRPPSGDFKYALELERQINRGDLSDSDLLLAKTIHNQLTKSAKFHTIFYVNKIEAALVNQEALIDDYKTIIREVDEYNNMLAVNNEEREDRGGSQGVHRFDTFVFGSGGAITKLLTMGRHLKLDDGSLTWQQIQDELIKFLPKEEVEICLYGRTSVTPRLLKSYMPLCFGNIQNELSGFFTPQSPRCEEVRELWSRIITLARDLISRGHPTALTYVCNNVAENYLTGGHCLQGRIDRAFLTYVALLGSIDLRDICFAFNPTAYVKKIIAALESNQALIDEYKGIIREVDGYNKILAVNNEERKDRGGSQGVHRFDTFVFGSGGAITKLLTMGRHLKLDDGSLTWQQIQDEIIRTLPKDERLVCDGVIRVTPKLLITYMPACFDNISNELSAYFTSNPTRCEEVRELWSRIITLARDLTEKGHPRALTFVCNNIAENYLAGGYCLEGRIDRAFLTYVALLGLINLRDICFSYVDKK